jgi:effector-binding domain-containing protein
MITEPKLEDRKEQYYVAIRSQVTMNELGTAISQGIEEMATWLEKQRVTPIGAPFIRYLVIDMEALLEIEVGFPVNGALSGDDRVRVGILPAGRYASLVYSDINKGIEANYVLLKWGASQGLVWDKWATEQGEAFGSRFESFLTNPDDEPDQTQWETEVAIMVAADDRSKQP